MLVLVDMKKEELKRLCKHFGLKASGNKSVLVERLKEFTSLSKISSFSSMWREEYRPPRPAGRRYEFGSGNSELVGDLLGYHEGGRVETMYVRLRELALASVEGEGHLVRCYSDSSLKINKQVCKWCSRRSECAHEEQKIRDNFLTYDVYVLNRPLQQSVFQHDAEVLQRFVGDKNYMIRYPNGDRFIFDHSEDPFKPYFGRNNNRSLSFTPLGHVNTSVNPSVRGSWSHLFYSSVLHRTITVFEAMMIEAISAAYATQSSGTFPTLNHMQKAINDPAVSKLLAGLALSSEDNLSAMNIPHSDKTTGLVNLCKTTEAYYNNNLFSNATEIFPHAKEGETFRFGLGRFCNELVRVCNNQEPSDGNFLEERLDALLFSPFDMGDEISVFGKIRILRQIIVDGLTIPWLLVDGAIEDIETDYQASVISRPNETQNTSNSLQLVEHLNNHINHEANFRFYPIHGSQIRPNVASPQSGNTTPVLVFDSSELETAYAAEFAIRAQKASQSDPSFIQRRAQFEFFLSRFFLYTGDGRSSLFDRRRDFAFLLKLPSNRKLSTVKRLLMLAEEFPELVEFTDITTPEDHTAVMPMVTEQFILRADYRTLDEEDLNLEVKLVRRYPLRNLNSGQKETWSHEVIQGIGQMGPPQLLFDFVRSLEPISNPDAIELISRGVYISRGLTDVILGLSRRFAQRFYRWLGSHINTNCSPGVVCLALDAEIESHTNRIGPCEVTMFEMVLCESDDKQIICSWQPAMSVQATSSLAISTGLSQN